MAEYDGSVTINTQINTKNAAKQLEKLNSELIEVNKAVSSITNSIQKLEEAGKKVPNVMREMLAQYEGRAAEIESEIAAISEELKETGEKGEAASGRIKSAFSRIKNAAKSLLSRLAKLTSGFKGFSKSSDSATGSLGKGVKQLLKYTLGIRSLYAVFNKLKSAATEGFENLAQYSDDTNAALSNLKSALTQLKNSLATAFTPILEYIEPALTRMIDLLSSAATAMAKLTAQLTGKSTYIKATKVQEDYADSLNNTSNAANKLASWDTLETLSGSSGSGSSGTDAEDMFETLETEPLSFGSWGEAFSAFLAYILNEGIPALESGLTTMAGWINSFAANLYEMFTFPGVVDQVILLGKEIGNAFNNFVNLINWETIGGALGAGLNLALQFLVNLIYAFDWINFGSKLADAVNGAIAEIDWTSVGQWLWSGFKMAIETLAGFIQNLDMAQLAQAASSLAVGFFDSITETFQNIDWATIGIQVANFLCNVDWLGIAMSIWNVVANAFGAAITVLTMAIYTLGANIIESLIQGMEESGFLSDPQGWLNEHIVQPFLSAFETLREALSNIWTGIQNMIKNAINGIIGSINGLISGAVEGINSVIDTLNGMSFDIPDWVPIWGGSSFGLNISPVNAPQIPYLAQGAVIQGANPFLAVLGDQKSGQTNVEAPLSTIVDAVNMALDMRDDSGSGQPLSLNIYVSGRKLAQATIDDFVSEANRRGNVNLTFAGG